MEELEWPARHWELGFLAHDGFTVDSAERLAAAGSETPISGDRRLVGSW